MPVSEIHEDSGELIVWAKCDEISLFESLREMK